MPLLLVYDIRSLHLLLVAATWTLLTRVSVSFQRVYRALYDYAAQDHDEVSFRDGDVIINAQPIDEGWMYGTVQRTGKSGMLPANYVECCNWGEGEGGGGGGGGVLQGWKLSAKTLGLLRQVMVTIFFRFQGCTTCRNDVDVFSLG